MRLSLLLLLPIIILISTARTGVNAAIARQTDPQEDLKIAFVSNRDGDDDIYLMWLDPSCSLIDLMLIKMTRDWNPAELVPAHFPAVAGTDAFADS